MPQDDKATSGPEPPSKPSRTQEARRIVGEYADDLREILRRFRNSSSESSGLFHLNRKKEGALCHLAVMRVSANVRFARRSRDQVRRACSVLHLHVTR